MISRNDRCRLGTSVAGLLLLLSATGLIAAPLAGDSLKLGQAMGPIAVKPILVAPEAPVLEAADAVSLIRDQVYTAAKDLGADPEILGSAMQLITEQAELGQIDMASIHDVTAAIADYDVAMKVEGFLLGFAEATAFGVVMDGMLPETSPSVGKAVASLKNVRLGGVGELPGDLSPLNGGTCLACPSFDFGTFTPGFPWATHSESTDSSGDCNMYRFNTVAGQIYQFSLCPSDGSGIGASFDTILELYNAAGCALLKSNDDFCGTQSRLEFATSFTGAVILRVKGFGSAFGSYTLGYRRSPCSACLSPISTLTPTAACQIVEGAVGSSCPALFYHVPMTLGSTYQFTTCPGDCSGTSCTTVTDTVLELYGPTAVTCSLAERIAVNDDIGSTACPGFGLRSRLNYTATATGVYKIKARAFSTGTAGTICLGYRQTAGGGCTNNCATGPFVATISPTSTCQTHSASVVSPCVDTWYLVNVGAAGTHEFTTCSSPVCVGGSAGFDPILELYNSSCTLLASDNDSCGGLSSRLTFSIPTPGTYKLRVRSATGSAGPYTITYRTIGIACTSPSNVTVTPASGVASSAVNTCRITQAFSVTSSGTSTMTYNWTITPPAGGSAAPPSGSTIGAAGATNPGSFSSTLTREGNFSVNVTATNSCGSANRIQVYQLVDLTAPVFLSFPANTTVQCTAIPPVPTLSASDNCDPNPVETFSQVITPGSCPGRYSIARTWTARDRAGNTSAPRTQTITVVDTTPPVIVPDTTVKYCISPPNHELICFLQSQFSPVITDNCSPPITWRFVGVLNSEDGLEPCGDGNVEPDSVVAPDGSGFCVVRERCGNDPAENDGRLYLVLATATDSCGNTSQPTAIGAILVPHDSADLSACL